MNYKKSDSIHDYYLKGGNYYHKKSHERVENFREMLLAEVEKEVEVRS